MESDSEGEESEASGSKLRWGQPEEDDWELNKQAAIDSVPLHAAVPLDGPLLTTAETNNERVVVQQTKGNAVKVALTKEYKRDELYTKSPEAQFRKNIYSPAEEQLLGLLIYTQEKL